MDDSTQIILQNFNLPELAKQFNHFAQICNDLQNESFDSEKRRLLLSIGTQIDKISAFIKRLE